MKNLKKALALVATLTAISAGSAHAEGLYAGGNLGFSHYKGDSLFGSSTDSSDTALKLYGGYGITPNVAIETGYSRIGKFKSSLGDLRASGLFVDAVGLLPLGNGFTAMGRAGLFNGKLDSSFAGSDRGTSLKIGAGVQYDLASNVGVRGEWERYRFDALNTKTNADVYSVGVNYKF
jgi:OOP family OmpA-OmpF porin